MNIRLLVATVFSSVALLMIGVTFAQEGIGHGHDALGAGENRDNIRDFRENDDDFFESGDTVSPGIQRYHDDNDEEDRLINEKELQELLLKVRELRRLNQNEEADRLEAEIEGLQMAQAQSEYDFFSQAQDEYERNMDRYRQDIDRLNREGNLEEAERFTTEFMSQAAQQHQERIIDLEGEIRNFEDEIEMLRRRGSYEDAEDLERELRGLYSELDIQIREMDRIDTEMRFGGDDEEEIADIERKIYHLVTAADNLFEIGHDEQADELMAQAEELERYMRIMMKEDGEGDEGLRRHVEELTDVVFDLQREVAELREMVGQLRYQIEKSGRGAERDYERDHERDRDHGDEHDEEYTDFFEDR